MRAAPLLLLLAPLLALAGAPGPADGAGTGPGCKGPLGCEAWAARYDGPAGALDDAGALALDPAGLVAFATGHSLGTQGYDAATLAYDVRTGEVRWLDRFDGAQGQYDEGTALAVSPDGATLVVAAYGPGEGTQDDMVVVAYEASTGARRWVARHDSPVHGQDRAITMAMSPDGARAYAGGIVAAGSSWDGAVLALDARTGARAWLQALDGPRGGEDRVHALAVSPDGRTVFAGAVSAGPPGRDENLVAALDAADGAVRWTTRLPGLQDRLDRGVALALSPDGGNLLVAATVAGAGQLSDLLAASLDPSTGAVRWLQVYDHGPGGDDKPAGLALSPDGALAVLAGSSVGKRSGEDLLAVAYDARTGARAWALAWDGPSGREDRANALAFHPSGSLLALAGESTGMPPGGVHVALLGVGAGTALDYVTLLLDPADGTVERELRYQGPGHAPDRARGVGFGAQGARLLVTGHSHAGAAGYDYATLAYDLPPR